MRVDHSRQYRPASRLDCSAGRLRNRNADGLDATARDCKITFDDAIPGDHPRVSNYKVQHVVKFSSAPSD